VFETLLVNATGMLLQLMFLLRQRGADRIVEAAGGDPRLALCRQKRISRSITSALTGHLTRVAHAAAEDLCEAKFPLRAMPEDRYAEFLPAGEGGMGIVYMALDTELQRMVALKMIRPDAGQGTQSDTPTTPIGVERPKGDTSDSQTFANLEARFLQEAWVTGGLEHPGIVPVYELGKTPTGIPYYTMKFIGSQRTLDDALDDLQAAQFEERLVLLEPFLKLCDTVRYAHANGVTRVERGQIAPQILSLDLLNPGIHATAPVRRIYSFSSRSACRYARHNSGRRQRVVRSACSLRHSSIR